MSSFKEKVSISEREMIETPHAPRMYIKVLTMGLDRSRLVRVDDRINNVIRFGYIE